MRSEKGNTKKRVAHTHNESGKDQMHYAKRVQRSARKLRKQRCTSNRAGKTSQMSLTSRLSKTIARCLSRNPHTIERFQLRKPFRKRRQSLPSRSNQLHNGDSNQRFSHCESAPPFLEASRPRPPPPHTPSVSTATGAKEYVCKSHEYFVIFARLCPSRCVYINVHWVKKRPKPGTKISNADGFSQYHLYYHCKEQIEGS